MTQDHSDRIKRLLKLAELQQEFEFIDIKIVDAWCSLREELGLAKTLLAIQEYVTTKATNPATSTPETEHTTEDSNVVQQLRTSVQESH